MAKVADMLRDVARELRKHSAERVEPQPLPNPTASLASGDMGSLSVGAKEKGAPKSFAQKLPKVGV